MCFSKVECFSTNTHAWRPPIVFAKQRRSRKPKLAATLRHCRTGGWWKRHSDSGWRRRRAGWWRSQSMEPYGMEVALAMLPLTLPDEHGRLALCDPVQGPMLDEALALAKPSKKKGSKRSRGERRCWLRGPSVRGRRLRLRGSCRRGWRSRVRPGSAGRPTSRANAKWSPQPARSAPLENFGLFGMRKLPFMVRVEGKKFSTQKPKL